MGFTRLHPVYRSAKLEPVQQTVLSEGVDTVEGFEAALSDMGLIHRRLNLKKYRNCIHWHITMPGSRGTLEATFLGDSKRLWVEIRPGRAAAWQDQIVRRLAALFSTDSDV